MRERGGERREEKGGGREEGGGREVRETRDRYRTSMHACALKGSRNLTDMMPSGSFCDVGEAHKLGIGGQGTGATHVIEHNICHLSEGGTFFPYFFLEVKK